MLKTLKAAVMQRVWSIVGAADYIDYLERELAAADRYTKALEADLQLSGPFKSNITFN
jgi:hypothetical protein